LWFVVALALYAYTAAPDVPLVDSGELALAAASGGVAHPPGVPLYLLVGRVFALLPLGTPVRTMNLMSAFFSALAVGAVFVAAERTLALLGASARVARDEPARRLVAACAGAIAFATAYNPWTWSAVTEVYALNVFLLASSWAAAIVAAQGLARGGKLPFRGAIPAAGWRWWTASAVLVSLALANHHATGVVLFPALLLLAGVAAPGILRTRRFWIVALAALAGATSLYAYLFVAARNDPGLNWGGIDSVRLLMRHVTGQQYSQQVGSVPGETRLVLGEFFGTMIRGTGWLGSLLAALGIATALRRNVPPRVRLVVVAVPLLVIALDLLLAINYVAGPEDRMAYDLPAAVAWCLCAAVGAWALLARAPVAVGLAVVVAIGAENVARNGPLCNLRSEFTARRFVDEMLADVPPNSVLLTAEWNFYAPFLYRRHLEEFREDLRVIDVLMMRRFWYLAYVERMMPELVDASRAEFDEFRDQVTRFDLGQPYDPARIQSAYDALIRRWIAIGQASGRAFVDWACLEQPQEVSWIRGLPLAPDGLLLRVDEPDDTEPGPIAPADAANLRWVRSKLNDAALNGDFRDLRPRHDPYRKVWVRYQNAVQASLVTALRRDDGSFTEWSLAYATWYPELERAQAGARATVSSLGSR
jgi:hypothetical protein